MIKKIGTEKTLTVIVSLPGEQNEPTTGQMPRLGPVLRGKTEPEEWCRREEEIWRISREGKEAQKFVGRKGEGGLTGAEGTRES